VLPTALETPTGDRIPLSFSSSDAALLTTERRTLKQLDPLQVNRVQLGNDRTSLLVLEERPPPRPTRARAIHRSRGDAGQSPRHVTPRMLTLPQLPTERTLAERFARSLTRVLAALLAAAAL
jgi:hypothetical protein